MIRTRVGYSGGITHNPTYHNLGGHAETVQMDFDPSRITYKDLLGVFWEAHDPTRPMMTRQYMSAVFHHDEEQKLLAYETRDQYAVRADEAVYTEISEYREFYLAEDYHQKHALQRYSDYMNEFMRYYPTIHELLISTAAARVNGFLAGYGSFETLRNEIDLYGLSEDLKRKLLRMAGVTPRITCKLGEKC